jgi:hypothetical protein
MLLKEAKDRNGFPPFPETLVISAERSGLNLVRHACERLSGRRTPGKPHILKEGQLLFHRTHYAGHKTSPIGPFAPLFDSQGTSRYSKCLILLRDPAETFVRAYDKSLVRMRRYCENIRLFDSFLGPKLTVTYDDLVGGSTAMAEIFAFLGIGDCFDSSALARIRREAIEWYDRNQPSGSQTRGDPGLLNAHQAALSAEERAQLRDLLDQELKHLVAIYLYRWNSTLNAS